MKKIIALLMTLTMMVSVFGIVAVAETKSGIEAKITKADGTTDVFEGETFTVDVILSPKADTQAIKAFQFDLTYDVKKVEVEDDGFGGPVYTIPYDSRQIVPVSIALNETTGVLKFSFAAGANFAAAGLAIPADGKIVSFNFTAKEGSEATGAFITSVDAAIFEDQNGEAAQLADSSLENKTDLSKMVVNEIPAKPTLEGAKITGTMESGKTLTASYTFNNGKSSDTASDDKTTFAWFADGEAIVDEEGKAITTKTLVLNDSLVGAVITCEATPNTSRTPADKLNAKGDKVTLKTEPADAIVMPAEGYVPTAEVTIEKITAGKAPEVDVDIKALAAMTTSADYKWYVVAEADDEADAIADLKAAIEAGGEGAPVAVDTELLTEKLTKEYKGQYAVLEVIAKAKIADKTYTAAEAVYDAAEIKVKKSGGTTQTGASLVTGGNVTVKPEEPVKPEDPEVPTEPEKDPEDPAGTANDKGAAAFTDVDKEAYAWAYDSIDTLAKAGVIKGMTETTFGPELTTTNAQVIALAVRIAGLTAEEGATTDKVDAEHWVAGEMAIADANEILAVFGDKVDVEGETTREIAFTLLYNALKAAGVELPETAEAIEYSDAASISEGCVEAIEALTKAGIVNGMGDGTLAPKATITRAQLAKILGLAEALIK